MSLGFGIHHAILHTNAQPSPQRLLVATCLQSFCKGFRRPGHVLLSYRDNCQQACARCVLLLRGAVPEQEARKDKHRSRYRAHAGAELDAEAGSYGFVIFLQKKEVSSRHFKMPRAGARSAGARSPARSPSRSAGGTPIRQETTRIQRLVPRDNLPAMTESSALAFGGEVRFCRDFDVSRAVRAWVDAYSSCGFAKPR